VNLKPDTFKIWEPKIIGIVLSFSVEWSTQMGTPLCRTEDYCDSPCAREKEKKEQPPREAVTKEGKNEGQASWSFPGWPLLGPAELGT
jgi:hypothetical protein